MAETSRFYCKTILAYIMILICVDIFFTVRKDDNKIRMICLILCVENSLLFCFLFFHNMNFFFLNFEPFFSNFIMTEKLIIRLKINNQNCFVELNQSMSGEELLRTGKFSN